MGGIGDFSRFENQTMYSCGSVAPRNFKKFDDGGGCMRCTVHGASQPWEKAEGAFHCLIDLNASCVADAEFSLPRLAEARELFKLSHFPHHCQYKNTVCERLRDLFWDRNSTTQATQEGWWWSQPEGIEERRKWIALIKPAAEQTEHRALQLHAKEALRALEIKEA